ncbi:MAG TPA: hypothetical protein DHW79_02690 [Candidatus Cloacimonas sp.]|nr:hypothetical protein [Candidatus Cloacimonas sp.]
MRISVFMKTGDADTMYYLSALVATKLFSRIDVFRDQSAMPLDGVVYHKNHLFKKGFVRLIERFLSALLQKDRPDMYIGVYEIPHGVLAWFVSRLRRRGFILSIIGNPGHTGLRKGVRLYIMKHMIRCASAVTVTGYRSKQVLKDMGVNEDKVFALPNSIPVELFKDLSIKDRPYDLISLGRISPEKHIDIILKIVQRLAPDLELQVAIAGRGPSVEGIEDMVKRLGLNQQIRMLGYIPDNELESFFNSGKIFVVCSETEGFPRTILQAASCGSLIVSSSVGDIPEIIRNGKNGFLVAPYDNIDEYCSFITQALRDSDASLNMSQRLQKEVHNLFSTESAAKVWVSIFKSV